MQIPGLLRAAILRRAASAGLCVALLSVGAAADAAPLAGNPRIDAVPFPGDSYPARRTAFAGGVTGFADVVYSTVPGFRPLTLDLYRPAAAGTHPLVIYIHGGGWSFGHSRQAGAFAQWPRVLASLAARGYVVTSLNYRLSGEAPFPAAIQDVKTSIRWLRAHAAEYGIDPARVLVWGGSAGGHLAALAATSCGVTALEPPKTPAVPREGTGARATTPTGPDPDAQSDCVQAAVTWYGIFDVAAAIGTTPVQAPTPAPAAGPPPAPSALTRFLGCGAGPCPAEQLRLASASSFVGAKTPPFLLVHGDHDRTVDPGQSKSFDQALRAAGIHSELLMIAGADHSFIGATPAATREYSLRALEATFAFIDATFGPRAAAAGRTTP
jgi:acetyl esterase/lipase